MEFCDKESLLLFSLSSSRCLWAIDLIVTTIICRQWFQLKWFLAMIWPWLLFDYYHPKSSKSRFAQCFQWFCNHSEKAGNLVENRTILENAAFYQDAPENSDCWYVFCSAIMKHSGGFKPFTKVTSPLGSIARACRFKSCRAHHEHGTVLFAE